MKHSFHTWSTEDELKKNYFNHFFSYREALFKYPKLRQTYLNSVIAALPSVADSKSLRSLLWLIGEFCVDNGNILAAIQAINAGLGELPMLAAEEKYEATLKANGDLETSSENVEKTQKVSTKILADGTYASEIRDETVPGNNATGRQLPNIKSKIIHLFFRFIKCVI